MNIRDLQRIREIVVDDKDIILIDECIKFMKKVDDIKDIATESDKDEIFKLILNIVRIYLMIQRDKWGDDEETMDEIKNDLQGTLSSIFRLEVTRDGGTKLVFFPGVPPMAQNIDRELEFRNIIRPFISFVETNIYYAFVTAYNELISQLHDRFCVHSSLAAGILKTKKEEIELPQIPDVDNEDKKLNRGKKK